MPIILLDPREGSKELLPYFKPYDVEVVEQLMDAGDLAFWGNGHDGPVLIGIEHKTIHDLIASMRSNRLSGSQLTGLLETYAFIILIVQGIWRCGDTGEIEVHAGTQKWIPLRLGSRPVLYREVEHYLATLEHRCGVVVHCVADYRQSVAFIVSRYKWWTDKEWSKHDSHEAIYAPYQDQIVSRRGSFTRRTVGPVELVAAQFPGINKKAYEFGKAFRSVHEMVSADVLRLSAVTGVGKKGADKIHRWLRGEIV